jgi:DNA replication and repair protein RecF
LLRLKNISLTQFKNYPQATFQFNERIAGICGKNGVGKTNLLDAIYYLCFTRSYFSRSDIQNVSTGMQGFRLWGQFAVDGSDNHITCVLRENGKKEFSFNDDAYSKFSEHIGRFPSVIIAPDDVHIITGGGEERRRFLDALLSQIDRNYLSALISYNKILQQRNSLLKSFAETRRTDESLLEVLNEQLSRPGTVIFNKRKSFLTSFIPLIQHFYKRISGEAYNVSVVYESQLLHAGYETLFHQFRDKDLVLQRTGAGIHKDDLEISLNGQIFKTMASQGQRKSLLFALKLAEFETLKQNKGFSPLLLLDDVFEKLDQGRMQNLLEWVCKENDGQIFITDTHCERLKEHLEKLQVAYQLVNL